MLSTYANQLFPLQSSRMSKAAETIDKKLSGIGGHFWQKNLPGAWAEMNIVLDFNYYELDEANS